MTCRRPTFDIKVSVWVERLSDDADWRPVYWCPDCGAMATHRATCTMFPGEPVVHGNRTPPPADIAAKLRFAIDNAAGR
jgi:acetone carboxylase gamma subunit